MVGKDKGEMGRVRMKDKKVIELFNEKTMEVVKTICYHDQKQFDEFVKGFKEIRYPGYGWRCRDKVKTKEKHELGE